ncbi:MULTISPECIES: LptF/LptG family permease [unclassified Arcicella]|uniref:LptF/LptG family permease n=1 Tax=unclassified Arcicella TaxID=2644986 RepID=UPI002857CA64|nr:MULTISPECIES: LptF/LptG family permease [unclassified Arcicella]MDR6561750.1 lipopolysaccharide export system permease protein [Arcicella sp. BE51]MDR6812530.1 lipopolysaccharide export system permease protein [Arcicella sp. BE140]MDR6823698.1 lipopolysaccharide export system permease protein [Arcicella sp. BE139]
MIKKLDKLIIKSFWQPFVLTLAVVIFIFLMRLILVYFADLFGKDLGVEVYFELFFYFSLITIPIALPLAMLLSTLMTYGKLGEFFELTAIKSAGISITRAMQPMFIVTVLITLFAFWFNNVALPWANLKGYRLLYDIKTTKTTLNIKEGIFYNDLPGYSIKVSKKYPDNKTLKNIVIFDHTKNDGNKHLTLADSALMYTIMDKQYLIFELFNGNDYVEDADKTSNTNQTDMVTHAFRKSKVVMSLAAFDMHKTEEEQFKHYQMMRSYEELAKDADSLKRDFNRIRGNFYDNARSYYLFEMNKFPPLLNEDQKKLKKMKMSSIDSLIKKRDVHTANPYQSLDFAISQVNNALSFAESNVSVLTSKDEDLRKTNLEWHHKFTNAIAVFVMFLIGAPLGGIIKKGGFGLPVVIAIVFFILMYVMTQQGDKAAKESRVIVQIGAWISNTVLFLIGLYFLNKAKNDSRLFESDAYIVYFNQLKEKLKKAKFSKRFFNNYS